MDNNIKRQFLSPQELSAYIGLSLNTIYSWVSQKRIPYIKVSRLVKFNISEIDNWMKAMRVAPTDLLHDSA
jgi:excisionase family DNA binding protein